jgi:hypothetical protein
MFAKLRVIIGVDEQPRRVTAGSFGRLAPLPALLVGIGPDELNREIVDVEQVDRAGEGDAETLQQGGVLLRVLDQIGLARDVARHAKNVLNFAGPAMDRHQAGLERGDTCRAFDRAFVVDWLSAGETLRQPRFEARADLGRKHVDRSVADDLRDRPAGDCRHGLVDVLEPGHTVSVELHDVDSEFGSEDRAIELFQPERLSGRPLFSRDVHARSSPHGPSRSGELTTSAG